MEMCALLHDLLDLAGHSLATRFAILPLLATPVDCVTLSVLVNHVCEAAKHKERLFFWQSCQRKALRQEPLRPQLQRRRLVPPFPTKMLKVHSQETDHFSSTWEGIHL